MLLARLPVAVLWLGAAFWFWPADSLNRNPLETRRISNASYPVYRGECYDHRTGIVLARTGKPKKFKHLCMRATCFRNYTMLVESCRKTTCAIPNVRYTSNYPRCCPEVLCKKGNRVRYLLTNETVTSIPTRRPTRTAKRKAKPAHRKRHRNVTTTAPHGEKENGGAKEN